MVFLAYALGILAGVQVGYVWREVRDILQEADRELSVRGQGEDH